MRGEADAAAIAPPLPPDLRERIGAPIGFTASALAHGAIIGILIAGGDLFEGDDFGGVAAAEVRLVSVSEFGALVAKAPQVRVFEVEAPPPVASVPPPRAPLPDMPDPGPVAPPVVEVAERLREPPADPRPKPATSDPEPALLAFADSPEPVRAAAPDAPALPLVPKPPVPRPDLPAQPAKLAFAAAPAKTKAPEAAIPPAVRDPRIPRPDSPAPPSGLAAATAPEPVRSESPDVPALPEVPRPPSFRPPERAAASPPEIEPPRTPPPPPEPEPPAQRAEPPPPEPSDPGPSEPEPPPPDSPQPPQLPAVAEADDVLETIALLTEGAREIQRQSNRAPRRLPGGRGALTIHEYGYLRDRLAGCWNLSTILGARDAANLRVTVQVQLTRDGRVASAPKLIRPSPLPTRAHKQAFNEARRAVRSCAPYLGLDAANYGNWRLLELTFDPRGMMAQ